MCGRLNLTEKLVLAMAAKNYQYVKYSFNESQFGIQMVTLGYYNLTISNLRAGKCYNLMVIATSAFNLNTTATLQFTQTANGAQTARIILDFDATRIPTKTVVSYIMCDLIYWYYFDPKQVYSHFGQYADCASQPLPIGWNYINLTSTTYNKTYNVPTGYNSSTGYAIIKPMTFAQATLYRVMLFFQANDNYEKDYNYNSVQSALQNSATYGYLNIVGYAFRNNVNLIAISALSNVSTVAPTLNAPPYMSALANTMNITGVSLNAEGFIYVILDSVPYLIPTPTPYQLRAGNNGNDATPLKSQNFYYPGDGSSINLVFDNLNNTTFYNVYLVASNMDPSDNALFTPVLVYKNVTRKQIDFYAFADLLKSLAFIWSLALLWISW